jgi:hypothetical protein
MAKQRGSFPHPVVDATERDVVGSRFQVIDGVSREATQENCVVHFEIECTDNDLNRLMKEGRAGVRVRVSCSATLRNVLLEPAKTMDAGQATKWALTLPQKNYSGEVECEVLVVALQPLSGFSFANQHADYAGAAFEIRKGEVLALGGKASFDIAKWFDPMNPPITSFLIVRLNDDPESDLEIELGNEVIEVKLPPKAYPVLPKYQVELKELLYSVVVAPALTHALTEMKREGAEAEYGESAWYTSLTKLVEKHAVTGQPLYKQVQEILDSPHVRGLEKLAVRLEQVAREEY